MRNYRRAWLFSACAVFSLTAFMVPLLTLLGIKEGIIGSLTLRLIENPRNLELTPVGVGRFEADFFKELAEHPETAFIIPETRSISAAILLQASPDAEARWIDLSATGPGDPLLAQIETAAPPPDIPAGQLIHLSAAAAENLKTEAGGRLWGSVSRKVEGHMQKAGLELVVVGVIPRHVVSREMAFVPLSLMEMTEDYRNGFSVPLLGWPGREKPSLGPTRFAGFRLYARALDGVEVLRQYLAERHLEVNTKAEDIALVRSLDHSFTVVFIVLGSVVGLGAFASATSSALDQVIKMRRALALLRLLGFSTGGLLIFAMSQAALTGFLAAALADGLFLLIAAVLNDYFGPSLGFGERVCRLGQDKLLITIGVSLGFMLLASAAAGWKISGVEPSEGMRDV